MADATTFPTQWGVPSGGAGSLPPQSTLSSTLNAPISPSMLKPSAPPPPVAPPAPAAPAPQPAPMLPPPTTAPRGGFMLPDPGIVKGYDANSAQIVAAQEQLGQQQGAEGIVKAQGGEDIARQQNESDRQLFNKQLGILQQEAQADAPFVPTKDSLPSMALAFALIGMIGSALGGKSTTMAALGAQQAMTGMLKGWQDGDAEKYKEQKDAYDANVAHLQRSNALAKEAFDIYQKEAVSDINLAKAHWDVNIAKADAPVLATTAKLKGYDQVQDQLKFHEEANGKLVEANNKIVEASQKLAQTQALGGLTDETANFLAQNYLTTGQMPALGMGSANIRTAILNKAAQMAAANGVSGSDLAGIAAGYVSGRTALSMLTKQYDAASSNENAMLANMKVAEKAEPRAQMSAMPFLNKWLQTGSTSVGMEGAPAYATAIVTVADKYAKVLSGSTGAAPASDASRAQAFQIINPYLNQGQIGEVFKIMRQDTDNTKKSYLDQIAEQKSALTGGANPPPPDTTKPVPTQADRDLVKNRPDLRQKFIDHFGVNP